MRMLSSGMLRKIGEEAVARLKAEQAKPRKNHRTIWLLREIIDAANKPSAPAGSEGEAG